MNVLQYEANKELLLYVKKFLFCEKIILRIYCKYDILFIQIVIAIMKRIANCRKKTYNKHKKRNKNMSEIQKHNTIFDDVFRTMVQKMPK